MATLLDVFAHAIAGRVPHIDTAKLARIITKRIARTVPTLSFGRLAVVAILASAVGCGAWFLLDKTRSHSRPGDAPVAPVMAWGGHPLVHAERVRRHDAAPLIASVFHLIVRGAAARYRRALARAFTQCPDLQYQVSGPFPPYAFVPEEA